MPASRSRTENWRKCLWQVYERNGAIEISIPNNLSDDIEASASDLVWRVRVLNITDDLITVETPCALGKQLHLEDGVQLVGAIVVGQNRWMFRTCVKTHTTIDSRNGRPIKAVCLQSPVDVERCGRRNFYRVATASLTLPRVRCWPLIDPASAVVAELANEEQVRTVLARQQMNPRESTDLSADGFFIEQLGLPEVGPPFEGTLANIGGGGLGLIIDPDYAAALTSNRMFWLQFALPPEIPVGIAVTAKLAHTHIDSSQATYAGMAFDFSRNKPHQEFVFEQLCRYTEMRQVAQSNLAA